MASDSAALPAGHKVLEYEVRRTLGAGGFGITYLAHDTHLDTPIALKEYFPATLGVRADDGTVGLRSDGAQEQFQWGLERFLDEARALASFRHPHIVRVLRYFRERGTAYIVMEYETGDPLHTWRSRQPSFNQHDMLDLAGPLLDGLEAVHRTGFLHRDIKPDNIYVRRDDQPVLLDFGSARRVTGERDLTSVITPGFAPFEQYHSRGNQGPWTDIYALGAVLYWMLGGRKPIESPARVVRDEMPRAAEVADAMYFGSDVLRAIDWALSPDEKSRPQSIAEFRSALLGQSAAEASSHHQPADETQLLFNDADETGLASPPPPPATFIATQPSTSSPSGTAASASNRTTTTPHAAQGLESELVHHIGPLGRVLVRKGLQQTTDLQALRELVAPAITDPAARAAFLAARPTSQRHSQRSTGTPSTLQAVAAPPTSTARQTPATPEQLAQLERTLSQHIGPLAKMITRKEAQKHSALDALVHALSLHIDQPADRTRFVAALQRLLAG